MNSTMHIRPGSSFLRISMWMLTCFAAIFACAGEYKCANCAISVDVVMVIGDPAGDNALSSQPLASAPLSGEYRVITVPWGGLALPPAIYDHEGRFALSVGSAGDGPGEFRQPALVLSSHDTAFIADGARFRTTVLFPPDAIVRVDTWEHEPIAIAELPDGSFVMATDNLRAPLPFKHVTRNGRVISEFTDSATAKISRHQVYHLASASDETFWSAPYYGSLQLRHWSAPGKPAALLIVETPHYRPYSAHQAATETTPESPMLMGMWLEASGSIMLAVRVADDDWDSAYGPLQGGEGPYPFRTPIDLKKAYDTMLLRVDSQTGAVIAERRLDEYVTQVTAPGEVVATSQTSDGFFQLTVLRVSAPLLDN